MLKFHLGLVKSDDVRDRARDESPHGVCLVGRDEAADALSFAAATVVRGRALRTGFHSSRIPAFTYILNRSFLRARTWRVSACAVDGNLPTFASIIRAGISPRPSPRGGRICEDAGKSTCFSVARATSEL